MAIQEEATGPLPDLQTLMDEADAKAAKAIEAARQVAARFKPGGG